MYSYDTLYPVYENIPDMQNASAVRVYSYNVIELICVRSNVCETEPLFEYLQRLTLSLFTSQLISTLSTVDVTSASPSAHFSEFILDRFLIKLDVNLVCPRLILNSFMVALHFLSEASPLGSYDTLLRNQTTHECSRR